MSITADDLCVLRAFNVGGAMTVDELARMSAGEGLKQSCERLWSNRLLDADRAPHKPAIYTISAKGRRMLGKKPEMGQFPAPRSSFMTQGTYTGERSTPARPGADDFLSCPSRRGSEFVEHRGPITLAGAQA